MGPFPNHLLTTLGQREAWPISLLTRPSAWAGFAVRKPSPGAPPLGGLPRALGKVPLLALPSLKWKRQPFVGCCEDKISH